MKHNDDFKDFVRTLQRAQAQKPPAEEPLGWRGRVMAHVREIEPVSPLEKLGREFFGFMLKLGVSAALVTVLLNGVAGSDTTVADEDLQQVALEFSAVPDLSLDSTWSDQ